MVTICFGFLLLIKRKINETVLACTDMSTRKRGVIVNSSRTRVGDSAEGSPTPPYLLCHVRINRGRYDPLTP